MEKHHPPKGHKKISKFLSLVLRHRPDILDLDMDEQGWVSVDELIQKSNAHGRTLDLKLLQEVVADNDKQRFSFDPERKRVRANQGHSVPVDLGYVPQQPPSELFHGTATRNLAGIFQTGLQKQKRHHVHLSPDEETARKVGARHGKAAVLIIASGQMHAQGHTFYLSANGVWLTEEVPAAFIINRSAFDQEESSKTQ